MMVLTSDLGRETKGKIRYHSPPASKLTDIIVPDDASGFFIFVEPLVTAIVQNLFY
jgi:hypothetical protein